MRERGSEALTMANIAEESVYLCICGDCTDDVVTRFVADSSLILPRISDDFIAESAMIGDGGALPERLNVSFWAWKG